ncbi:hypothetical protein BGZ47_004863 [Haplosporangium gracile]|nr:hypothetical protein BGZ47_004863 [Haplosporangium gracile]
MEAPANASPVDRCKSHPLMIPEILTLVGSYLPLFDRRFETGPYRFVDIWDPKPLLRAGAVCTTWHDILTPVLWRTYDHAIMDKKVPTEVLARYIKFVRHLSLLDKKHKKNTDLWDVLIKHNHINHLEIHDAVFPVKRLIGPNTHNLAGLKLSGNCTRMHSFLLIFVERQVHLKSLELTRFKFTASDWKRIVTNKPHLRKLIISQQCEFLDYKSEEDENESENKDDNKEVKVETKARKPEESTVMEMDATPATAGTTVVNNATGSSITTNNDGSKKRKSDDGAGNGRRNKRRRRLELVNVKLPDAKDIGILPITHLVLLDNLLFLPFQKAIIEACPYLEQLEICYSQKADGGKVATLVRENCHTLRRLSLHSTRQPWSLAMLEGAPQSVKDLVLHTEQLDLQMTAAIKDRKDSLTRLELDFGEGTKGKRRLACILSILRECTELWEFKYHNHAEDKVFKKMMFKNTWNLPNLRKLHLQGISPRVKYGGVPQVPCPEGWRQQYGGRKGKCCSARSFEEACRQNESMKSPLFDVALLEHVKDLLNLSEVVITEAIYRKLLD